MLGQGFTVSDLSRFKDVPPVEETGRSFEENAKLKAFAGSLLTSELVVADDSGLEVAALNSAPGVFSARYAGENATDAQNIAKLLAELRPRGCEGSARAARFCCAIAVAEAGAIRGLVFGTVDGFITEVAHGPGGFGYDPVFAPLGYRETFSELGDSVKNRISHRAMAVVKLRESILRLTTGSA